MTFAPRTIETRCASMSLTAPGFIEQRFRNDVTIDRAGFEENRRARHELGGSGPYVMLTFFPEGMDFDLGVTTTDHFQPERGSSGLSSLAVVARDSMGEAIAKLYFSYFPPHFNARVFKSEADARAWLTDAAFKERPMAG
ncbi:MAG: STAS/SEC14 domain-containing protein [Flavobacteriales bacterium]|nr:STAS/SEC14 domain-containing protein [Flavobacteriales bacterium]